MTRLLPLLALLACAGGAPTDAADDGGDNGENGGDNGSGAPAAIDGTTARLSTVVVTVVIVDWTPPDGADRVWVEYGPDTGYGLEAPERSAGHAVLVGTTPNTTVHLRVAAAFGDEVVYGDDLSITTGALPDTIPEPTTLTDAAPGEPWGDIVFTSLADMGRGRSTVVGLNRAGEVVWYVPRQNGFILSIKAARDGRSMLYLWEEDIVDSQQSNLCRFDMDGETETCVEVDGAHHDFWELADGSFVYPQAHEESWESYTLISDQLVRRAEDGTKTVLWDAFAEITPVPDGTWGGGRGGVDWIHTNGIWHDEAEDAWYISSYKLENIRKVPAATGRSEWVVGLNGDFDLDGSFGAQHAPQLTDDGLLLFDNASNRDPSALVLLDLDTNTMTATETMRLELGSGSHAAVMGDAHLLPNGYFAGTFGDAGRMAIFSPGGAELWTLRFEGGLLIGPALVYDSPYGMLPD